jgi:hypothetical protein
MGNSRVARAGCRGNRTPQDTEYAKGERMDNGNAPATKQDLHQAVEQLRSEMQHNYNDLAERITDGETRLLKAFYGYAESNQKRMVEVEGNEAALRSRLGTLEGRVLEVEKRLNIPPSS